MVIEVWDITQCMRRKAFLIKKVQSQQNDNNYSRLLLEGESLTRCERDDTKK